MSLSASERARLYAAKKVVRKINRKLARERKAARPLSPKRDRGRVRNNAFLAYLRRQPCAIAGRRGHICEGRTEAAHIRTPRPGEPPTGLQRKPNDDRANSLCLAAHREQHTTNELRWWRSYGLDPFETAAASFARFEAERG